MRTTIRLDDELLRRAKALANRTGRSLTKLIHDALLEVLERTETTERPERFEMLTACGDGPRPGVDLDDSAALWDLTEDRAADRR